MDGRQKMAETPPGDLLAPHLLAQVCLSPAAFQFPSFIGGGAGGGGGHLLFFMCNSK